MQSLILSRSEKFKLLESIQENIVCYEIFVGDLELGILYKHDKQSFRVDGADIGEAWLKFECDCKWCRHSEELLRQTCLLPLVSKIYGFQMPVFHLSRVWQFLRKWQESTWLYILRHNGQIIYQSTTPSLREEGALLSLGGLRFDPRTQTGKEILLAIQNVADV